MADIEWVVDGLKKHQISEYDTVDDIVVNGYMPLALDNNSLYIHFGTPKTLVFDSDSGKLEPLGNKFYYYALVNLSATDRYYERMRNSLADDNESSDNIANNASNASENNNKNRDAQSDIGICCISDEDAMNDTRPDDKRQYYIVINYQNKYKRSVRNYIAYSLALALLNQYKKFIKVHDAVDVSDCEGKLKVNDPKLRDRVKDLDINEVDRLLEDNKSEGESESEDIKLREIMLLIPTLCSYFTAKLLNDAKTIDAKLALSGLDNSIDYKMVTYAVNTAIEWEVRTCHVLITNAVVGRKIERPASVNVNLFGLYMNLQDKLLELCNRIAKSEYVKSDDIQEVRSIIRNIRGSV